MSHSLPLRVAFATLLIMASSLAFTQSDCHNLLAGGLLCCDQTICPDKTPLAINESEAPTGADGTIEYEWHQLRQFPDGSVLWEVIPGANGATYQPAQLAATSYFFREARRQGCDNWLVSNISTITVVPPGDPACDAYVSAQEPPLAAVRCFPNPFKENIGIQNSSPQSVRIQVYNALGVPLVVMSVKAGETPTLDTRLWPGGTYSVQIEDANGGKRSWKLVKL